MKKKVSIAVLVGVAVVALVFAFTHGFVRGDGRIWTGADLFTARVERVTVRDAQFFEGGDDTVNSVVQAFVMQQLLGGPGGLCDTGVTCEGRVVIKAGTHVRIIRSIQLKNNAIDETLDLIEASNGTGWITDRAFLARGVQPGSNSPT
jgi:hypothetical protein